jgi:hypothetical protein
MTRGRRRYLDGTEKGLIVKGLIGPI